MVVSRVRQKYQASWLGQPTGTSRGRTILVGASIIFLFVAVWWLGLENARHERDQIAAEAAANERSRLVSEYVACTQGVAAGAQIKATALEGVEHAERTAALWVTVVAILDEANPGSQLVNRIAIEVQDYVASVAEFRRVAEKYEPPELADCTSPPPFVPPD